jgi:predicted amidophosphoribosyltransferase
MAGARSQFMPLIKCPSCQSDVSTEADTCPKCGHRFKDAGVNLRDPVHVIGLIACAIIIVTVIYWIIKVLIWAYF